MDRPCKFAINPSGDCWECICWRNTYCADQIFDINPDDTVNVVTCRLGYEQTEVTEEEFVEGMKHLPMEVKQTDCDGCMYLHCNGECGEVDAPQTEVGYCNECKWFRDKQVCGRCRSLNLFAKADTPQTEEDYFLELMDAVERGEMSDAEANQAWYEYINKQDTPQTEDYDFRDEQEYNDRWGTDCGWGEPK